jgi:hypothetical protein
LLSKSDYLIQRGSNWSFCIPERGTLRFREENWRKIFRDINKKQILRTLLDDIEPGQEQNGLIKIIEKYLIEVDNVYEKRGWRYHFIRNKSIIESCEERQVRWNNENDITLLKRSTLNGYHAELYTFSYYEKFINGKQNKFQPFMRVSYQKTIGHDKSYVVFELEHAERKYQMKIYFLNGQFLICFNSIPENEIINGSMKNIFSDLGFGEENSQYKCRINKDEEEKINQTIKNVCDRIKQINPIAP